MFEADYLRLWMSQAVLVPILSLHIAAIQSTVDLGGRSLHSFFLMAISILGETVAEL